MTIYSSKDRGAYFVVTGSDVHVKIIKGGQYVMPFIDESLDLYEYDKENNKITKDSYEFEAGLTIKLNSMRTKNLESFLVRVPINTSTFRELFGKPSVIKGEIICSVILTANNL